MNFTRIFLISLLIANAGACTNLANNLQDPAVWDKIGKINDRYAQRDYERNHAVYDLTGEWAFTYKGKELINTIRHGVGGIMVIPNDGRKPVFYREAGRNVYRSGQNSYHFDSPYNGKWTSGTGTVLWLDRLH